MTYRTLKEQLEDPNAYWTCIYCRTLNLGTTDHCKKCQGIRKTA